MVPCTPDKAYRFFHIISEGGIGTGFGRLRLLKDALLPLAERQLFCEVSQPSKS